MIVWVLKTKNSGRKSRERRKGYSVEACVRAAEKTVQGEFRSHLVLAVTGGMNEGVNSGHVGLSQGHVTPISSRRSTIQVQVTFGCYHVILTYFEVRLG